MLSKDTKQAILAEGKKRLQGRALLVDAYDLTLLHSAAKAALKHGMNDAEEPLYGELKQAIERAVVATRFASRSRDDGPQN